MMDGVKTVRRWQQIVGTSETGNSAPCLLAESGRVLVFSWPGDVERKYV